MSAESKSEDWEELDLEESGEAIMVDVDDVEELKESEAAVLGPHGCYGH